MGFGSVADKFNCPNSVNTAAVLTLMPDTKGSSVCVHSLHGEVTRESITHTASGQQTQEWTHGAFDWQVRADLLCSPVTELCVHKCKRGRLRQAESIRGEIGVPDWLCCLFVKRRILSPHHGTPGGHNARRLPGTPCSFYLFIHTT